MIISPSAISPYKIPTFQSGGGGGFDPADLNPVLWLDAGVGVTETAGATSAWANQGSGATDATQGTALNQPTYNASGFGTNSKPYMDFNGTNSFMTLGTEYSKLAEHTVFTVWEADIVQNGMVIADGNAFNQNFGIEHFLRATGQILQNNFGDGTRFSTIRSVESYSTLTTHIFANTYTSGDTATVMYLDGTELTNTIISANANNISGTKYEMAVGRYGTFSGFYFNGKIAEIVVFDYVLTSDEITSMETYLNNKYSA